MLVTGIITTYLSLRLLVISGFRNIYPGRPFHGDVINEGKAGSFIGFDDPDGNQLYLAEINWSHVEKGEGQYQAAKA